MKIKLNIQQKIQFFVLTSTMILYVLVIAYISGKTKKSAKEDAIELVDSYAKQYANEIQDQLNADASVVRTLAQAYLVYKDFPEAEWKKLFIDMYGHVFEKNPQFYSIWDSWELNNFKSDWNKPYGRYVYTYWREGNKVKQDSALRSLDGDPPIYGKVKKSELEEIWNPYFDNFADQKAEQRLMTTISTPIIENGKYIGIVAVDITLDRFEALIDRIKPYKNSYAFFVAYDGVFVAHPNKELVGKSIAEENAEDDQRFNFVERVQRGETFSFFSDISDNTKEVYVSFAPVKIGKTTTPWSVGIVVPVKVIMEKAQKNYILSLLSSIFILAVLTVVILFISRGISNPIKSITRLLKRMSEGEIDESMKMTVSSEDEIAEMCRALDISIDGLVAKVEFANAIGSGDLSSKLELLSEKDILGKSLINMQDSLKEAKEEEEKRKIEDKKRTWINEGLAKFGDVLRQTSNLKELSYVVIKNLVNYLNANQGGLFIINDEEQEDKYLELISAFAFDRRKYLEKKIKMGEGLVGTCALEKKKIYLTDIPQNYIEITSGLGESNPNSLLLIPLKVEEDILGIIELASFNEFEPFEIEFVEKIAENIASTFSSVKINERTAQLLEQTKQQTEDMSAQEEEMRQNMEELQATQEEAARKRVEVEGLLKAVNVSSFLVEYDLQGTIININDTYLKLHNLPREQIVGSHHSKNFEFTEKQRLEYDKFWNDLRKGVIKKQTSTITVNGDKHVLLEVYTPVENEEGEVFKIMKIAYDITEYLNKKTSK